MPTFHGTTLSVPLVSVVDGDTIKVTLPEPFGVENIRILCLDTEEKPGSGGTKPKTPWGQAASNRAEQFFAGAAAVTLEFPGDEPVEICLRKYRGNFDRVLAFVYLGEMDFQEAMIREGFSPYFTKYGHADFAANHTRYRLAEREAQMAPRGVWDQETVNGSKRRDYPVLTTWWNLRAALIDRYRQHRTAGKPILNTRLDYAAIEEKAAVGRTVTLFTEVSRLSLINNGSLGFVDIGSQAQPFTLFLPEVSTADGQRLVNLLLQRYLAAGTDGSEPRRSYLYATGKLSLFQGKPQMRVTRPEQFTDDFPTTTAPGDGAAVRIVAALPDPIGGDSGSETVTLRNSGPAAVALEGWALADAAGNAMSLGPVRIAAGASEEVTVAGALSLNNGGDELILRDAGGTEVHRVAYTSGQVNTGQPVFF